MKTKRFAALFLTLAMLLGISPISVFASGGDDDGDSPQISLISAFVEPDVIEIAIGDERTEAEITDSFPDAVSATVNGTAGESVPVTEWRLVYASTADGAFSTSAQGEFYYEPTLAAGYTLSGEAILPSQKVQVGEALSHEPALASLTGSDFVVTGDASNYTWDDTNKVLTITGSGALEISMASGVLFTANRIVVQNSGAFEAAANITLNGVNIDASYGSVNAGAVELVVPSMANITLKGINTLRGSRDHAGLQVERTTTDTSILTIMQDSTGSLTAIGGNGGAGIGSGSVVVPTTGSGNIIILGGTVTATGNGGSAGIGGGYGGAGGDILISGSNVTTATGGGNGGAGIGSGAGGAGGNITIAKGMVTATGNGGGAGIGVGNGGTGGTFGTTDSGIAFIVASSISDSANIASWRGLIFGGASSAGQPDLGAIYGTAFTLSADASIPTGKTLDIASGQTLTVPNGKTLVLASGATITGNGGPLVNDGTVYRYGNIATEITIIGSGQVLPADGTQNPTAYLNASSVYLRENDTDKQISYDKGLSWQNYTGTVTLTGATTTNNVLVLSGVHDITMENLNIDLRLLSSTFALDIKEDAAAIITLQGINSLRSPSSSNALNMQVNSMLNITKASTGELTALGFDAVGIGGAGATINIEGGTVTATGGRSRVGLEGIITISGGTVIANGGVDISGFGVGEVGISGPLTITGGTVVSTGGDGAQAFSQKPNIVIPENQMAKVHIMAGNTSPGTAVLPSADYHTNAYVQISSAYAQEPVISYDLSLRAYTGVAQTLSVHSVTLGGTPLTVNTDYTISGNTATNAGEYTLTITGAGNYVGVVTKTYTIQRAPLTITGATVQSRAYNGITDATVDLSFGGLVNGETLVDVTDYTVSADFPSPNVGDNLTVGGVIHLANTTKASNYIFSTAEFSFPTTASITPLALAGAQVALGTPLVANGTQQTQSVASITLNGRTLAEGTDYTVSGNTATNAGSYTLTITGKGNYSGTLAVPFTVVGTAEEALPYEPTGTVDLDNSMKPSGNTLHINPQSEAQQHQDLAKLREFAQQNGITGEVHFLADITMTDANGGEVQPQDGNTRIRINVPGLTTADTVTVLHIKDDGSVEKITPVYVYNGYVEFFPTSFSVYSVIVHTAGTGTTSALSPQTGVYA